MPIQIRRGNLSDLPASAVDGQPLFTEDTHELYFGLGASVVPLTIDAANVNGLPPAGGTVTQVNTGTGLTGGPITGSGTISLANTTVSPNSYTNTNLTVDAQGRITAASNGSGTTSFDVNGTPVTDQTLLNFQSGTDITVSNPSAGNVLFTFTGVLPANTPAVTHEFVTAYNSGTGVFTQAQPAYSDISGTPQLAQTFTPVFDEFLTGYNAITGIFTAAQPALAGLSDVFLTSLVAGDVLVWNGSYWVDSPLPASTSFDVNGVATLSETLINFQSGSNITVSNPSAGNVSIAFSGQLAQTKAAITSNWLNSYNATTGLFTATQPAYTDISGTPQLAQTFAPVTNEFLTGYNATTGLFSAAHPALSEMSDVSLVSLVAGDILVWNGSAWINELYDPSLDVAWSNLQSTLSNGQVIPYADAGISRLGAASLAIGNGTAGDFTGSLKLTNLTAVGTVAQSTGQVHSWNADTGISRLGANNIGFGNGTQGDYSGTIQCGNATVHTNLSVLNNTYYYGSINMQATGTATSGQNYGSAAITADGTFYNSGVVYDYWNFQTLMGTGTAPTSTLYFSHTGSTGQTNIRIPPATVFEWSTDTGISRLGAASLAIGNGTAGDYSGSLNANAVNLGTSSDYLTFGGAWAGGLPYGYAGIWHTQATPSSTNYIMLACNAAGYEPNSMFFNEPTGGKDQFRINNVAAFGVGADLCLQIGGYPSAVDTGISRIGAASLAIGNGTQGDFTGSLKLTGLNVQGSQTGPYSVSLTAQAATIAATNLVATPVTTALYEITYYLNDTTAGTSGTVSLTITWNDGGSQTFTSSNVTFGTLGAYVSGTIVVKATSGAIQYATTVTSAVGSPAYSLDIRVKQLA